MVLLTNDGYLDSKSMKQKCRSESSRTSYNRISRCYRIRSEAYNVPPTMATSTTWGEPVITAEGMLMAMVLP